MAEAFLKTDFNGCLRCKILVENASRYINGIEDILVDFKTNTIKISFNESSSEALDQIKDIVKEMGHKAELVEDWMLNI